MKTVTRVSLAAAVALALGSCASMQSQQGGMSFFVSSVGSGKGADLGGLEGADRHCQSLAKAVGSGGRTWHAYLSTTGTPGYPGVNARDRIGSGPWQNAKGVVVASNVDQLHGANNLTKETALNEKGEMVNGRTEKPNMHDMLTGSTRDGRAIEQRGYDLQQLDHQRRRSRDARAPRPPGPARRRRVQVLEFLAPVPPEQGRRPRLQPSGAARHGR